jgi:hypothetical protein
LFRPTQTVELFTIEEADAMIGPICVCCDEPATVGCEECRLERCELTGGLTNGSAPTSRLTSRCLPRAGATGVGEATR